MRLRTQMRCLSGFLISQCQKYFCVAFDKEAGGACSSRSLSLIKSVVVKKKDEELLKFLVLFLSVGNVFY